MTIDQAVAIEIVTIDFLSECVKRGATYEQAKAELMKSKEIIAKRVLEILQ